MSTTIAALFVDIAGPYAGLPGVELWDEERDARKYPGPWPVISHTPCPRWGKLFAGQPLWIKRTGERKKKGDDGGCFAASLEFVRKYGGVIEHPEHSHAWAHFGLNRPPREGGWIVADFYGGWTCCVEQGRYGHYARKPTWLYACKVKLPELDWGRSPSRIPKEVIERLGEARAKKRGEVACMGGGTDSAPRIHTPEPFRDLLIEMARSAAQ